MYGFKYSYLTLIILKKTRPIDETLTDKTTTPGQSGPEGNGNEGVLHNNQNRNISTGCVIIKTPLFLVRILPSLQGMQSAFCKSCLFRENLNSSVNDYFIDNGVRVRAYLEAYSFNIESWV